MNKAAHALDYLRYRLRARTKYDVHSPFVYELLTRVINDRQSYPAYKPIEALRKELLHNDTIIKITDLGAGSKNGAGSLRKIKDICRLAEKNKKYGQLLFRLVHHFKPALVIDLGTSLGVTTLYLSSGNPSARVITIEGCPETAAIAKKNFERLRVDNIELVNGNFDEVLENILSKIPYSGLHEANPKSHIFFFDGNHRKEPTLRYFSQCLAYAGNNDVFIFDDIRWSGEMKEAWEEIKNHPRARVTIDLFFMGLVFIRREQAKEHFVVKF